MGAVESRRILLWTRASVNAKRALRAARFQADRIAFSLARSASRVHTAAHFGGTCRMIQGGEWLVSDGERVVGPVTLDLIAKGLERGKLSPDALVRHRDSTEWLAAKEVPELSG